MSRARNDDGVRNKAGCDVRPCVCVCVCVEQSKRASCLFTRRTAGHGLILALRRAGPGHLRGLHATVGDTMKGDPETNSVGCERNAPRPTEPQTYMQVATQIRVDGRMEGGTSTSTLVYTHILPPLSYTHSQPGWWRGGPWPQARARARFSTRHELRRPTPAPATGKRRRQEGRTP